MGWIAGLNHDQKRTAKQKCEKLLTLPYETTVQE